MGAIEKSIRSKTNPKFVAPHTRTTALSVSEAIELVLSYIESQNVKSIARVERDKQCLKFLLSEVDPADSCFHVQQIDGAELLIGYSRTPAEILKGATRGGRNFWLAGVCFPEADRDTLPGKNIVEIRLIRWLTDGSGAIRNAAKYKALREDIFALIENASASMTSMVSTPPPTSSNVELARLAKILKCSQGHDVSPDAKYCGHCGQQIPSIDAYWPSATISHDPRQCRDVVFALVTAAEQGDEEIIGHAVRQIEGIYTSAEIYIGLAYFGEILEGLMSPENQEMVVVAIEQTSGPDAVQRTTREVAVALFLRVELTEAMKAVSDQMNLIQANVKQFELDLFYELIQAAVRIKQSLHISFEK